MLTREQAEQVMRVEAEAIKKKHNYESGTFDARAARSESNFITKGTVLLIEANRLLEQAGFEIRSKA